jgi:hypothetical protein
MAIYYTKYEGGNIYWCPIESKRSKIIKHLKRSHKLKSVGSVAAVFFTKREKIMRIWDCSLNGYRQIFGHSKINLKNNK